ncbi:MAG: hypothetical protein ABIY55_22930 [Kofleriaceae bacterium]
MFAARGPDGVARGAFVPLASGQGAGELAVPGELQATLAACDVVDVYARNPYYGRSGLLAPGTVFRFRAGGSAPAMPGAGPTVVIVGGFASLRNSLGDAPRQGQETDQAGPAPRTARGEHRGHDGDVPR